MNPDRQQTLDYLRAPPDGLWHWEESGALLVWHDGTTIAFREELVQIFEWLAPNGLPDFSALVLLLAACRDKVPQFSEVVPETRFQEKTSVRTGRDGGVLLAARKQLQVQLEAALDQLRKVSLLPAGVKAGIKARCVLAEAVFEAAKNERRMPAATVLSGLRTPTTEAELQPGDVSYTGSYIRQIHVVAEGLRPHSAESLALRMRTGLDALPREIEVNLPPTEQARQLIEELSRDAELGSLGRAARELMAALRLPRHLAETEQLAIGGVADITNRGPLDRLLLSELAHDDLTLSVRVALNEALYLRREPPMREPPGALLLLLDSGVRLWGVPRVLATAVELALIAREKQHAHIRASRAHKTRLADVDLLSRNGLTQHLGTLETEAQPGPSLPAFAALTAAAPQSQSVLITHRDTLTDPEFRRAISEHSSAVGFIATVDREGHFELHALPLSHRPPLCAADLDLDAVFATVKTPPVKVRLDSALPAIFSVQPFPFLLPVTGPADYWIKDGDVTYAALNDRRLVQFRDTRGARVRANDLPNGKTLWMDCVTDTLYLVKAGASQRPTRLVTVPLASGPLRVTDLVSGDEVKAIHRYGDAIVVIRDTDVRAHSLGDGRLLQRVLNPHRWIHGRYCKGQDHFYFVVWDGTGIRFEPVALPHPLIPPVIRLIFDRAGFEGPWMVHTNGSISQATGGLEFNLPKPLENILGLDEVRLSRDGHRVYSAYKSLKWARILDLGTGRLTEVHPSRMEKGNLNLDDDLPLPTGNLFRNFDSIARYRDGMILRMKNGFWYKVELLEQVKLIFHLAGPMKFDLSRLESPQKVPLVPALVAQGCSLRVAEWPCGSKAFFDKHGLLHLKSHDPKVPEISLVLTTDEVAGWTSDGYVCGPEFFFEGKYVSDPRAVHDRIKAFLDHL